MIGLLQEVSGKTDSIQAGITGLEVGQQAITHSLSVLQTLSTVSLGVSALSQVYLWRQFTRLNKRLDAMGTTLDRIHVMIYFKNRSNIETGLKQLELGPEEYAKGNRTRGDNFLTDAFDNLNNAANSYAGQLKSELDRRSERKHLRRIARYMIVAVLGEAACQIAMDRGIEAAKAIERCLPVLKKFAQWVFEQTVGKNPTRFLIPAMAAHGVTLDALSELFRQAALAGIIGTSPGRGASELFESLRADLFRIKDPMFRKRRKVNNMLAELAEAAAVVEDVNRVQSLAMVIREFERPGQSFRDIVPLIEREIKARAEASSPGFFAYVPAPEGSSAST